MLTQEILQHHLHYCPETGIFTWLKCRRYDTVGRTAGCKHHSGYINIMIFRRKYMAHRLAWLYTYGVWPTEDIDHTNGVRDDNRICNLREATRQQNMRNSALRINNHSGYKGVYRKGNKWQAQIRYNKKVRVIGVYTTPEEAYAVYLQFASHICGEFLHHSLKSQSPKLESV